MVSEIKTVRPPPSSCTLRLEWCAPCICTALSCIRASLADLPPAVLRLGPSRAPHVRSATSTPLLGDQARGRREKEQGMGLCSVCRTLRPDCDIGKSPFQSGNCRCVCGGDIRLKSRLSADATWLCHQTSISRLRKWHIHSTLWRSWPACQPTAYCVGAGFGPRHAPESVEGYTQLPTLDNFGPLSWIPPTNYK